MRYGFITDIHGNFESLQAAWAMLKTMNVEEVFCLGDIVNCGADPEACINFIKQNEIITVAGNHDWAVCGKRSLDFFDAQGQELVMWTRAHISESSMAFLQQLPLKIETEHFTAVHATLNDPQVFLGCDQIEDYQETLNRLTTGICFVGHTHEPYILSQSDESIERVGDMVVVETHSKYLVNVGSTGQPRDGNPDACLAVYDTDTKTLCIKRAPYNVALAQRKICDAGLPREFSDRLSLGR